MRILIVEDDATLASQLQRVLTQAGFVAEHTADGQEAVFLAETESYDAAVLDLGLPGLDGISVLRHWRESGCHMPVLILTGRSRWSDKLAGFQAGADDYLTKPFMQEEVVLRLRALLRRSQPLSSQNGQGGDTVLRSGGLEYDSVTQRVYVDGQHIALTAQELKILAYLMHRPGATVTRTEIGEHVYSRDLDPDSNSLDVLIGRIRRKIGAARIETQRGLGFRLVDPQQADNANLPKESRQA
ncbi:response regulator transcription factor [Vandammella animalimorsus]|uniref:DNA-binding response regulator n=1 Tax=Vandammella animalimorsus TaxID=2029117 RepID=A0A2A2AYC3_9BURK|nr:response regulator transcription factor [Vandammella animalimorsus]PAT42741.1 DNA-binding response regulator [Vandammella animalimorsus]RRD68122.1 DNA-binding response regulator [Comamonadaceae bacterium OH2310_COT-174]